MKLFFSANGFKSVFFRVQFYSTKTLNSSSKAAKKETLYSRIHSFHYPKATIAPIIDQWIQEGNSIKDEELVSIIKSLKFSKRFNHALQISQWMGNQSNFFLSGSNIAGRLDLIARVHGIEKAEEYFATIPKESRRFPVYLSLLNCYVRGKCVEKAETLMPQILESGFTGTIPVYNGMLNLYSQVKEYEKFDGLVKEMEEKGIRPNKFTFSLQLHAYAALSNFDMMEKYLQMMEVDANFGMDWKCYAIAANIYIKYNLIDKALVLLKKSEELINGRNAYEHLLTLYATTNRKNELYRFWNQLKLSNKLYNTTYRSMISSLIKMDDIAGAEQILEEWYSEHKTYDFRVPKLLLVIYCKCGHMGKAEILVNRAIKKRKPFADTWEMLASGYIESDQIPKGVDSVKQGYFAKRPRWKPNHKILATCLGYLKEQGDAEKAEEFVRLLGVPDHMSIDDCEGLLDYIYNRNGKADSSEANKIDENGSDDETDELAEDATTEEMFT
ncbi:hypothetical protein ACHQM5_017336 [Ranunculus cassubicifolius]